jgi:hypothetical protein
LLSSAQLWRSWINEILEIKRGIFCSYETWQEVRRINWFRLLLRLVHPVIWITTLTLYLF